MKILITGGTTFVSRFAAKYFVARGHDRAAAKQSNNACISRFAYSYKLDDARAKILMPERIGLQDGIKRAYAHYSHDKSCVKRKGYIKFISENPDCFE